jgi:predicted ATP-grasp superfamily ATP-dependent carboligase
MSVLLLGAEYYGTLAAARCYGKNGIDVAMADGNRRARGLYSRHVKARLQHPPLSEPRRLLDWLVDYGAQHPGTLLYPSNDHLAWLFAANRERLGRVFLTYAPDEHALITLLDKKRLHAVCAGIGIDVPKSEALRTREAGALAVDRLAFPLLLKPRTQVFLGSGVKGFVAHDGAELATALARFHQLVRHGSILTERHPDISEPIAQEYLTAAETNIFSVSGFATKTGSIVCRAAVKVLQRPRKVGIGLCFEGRPMEEDLADKIAVLCARVGYHGCFEAEFIIDGSRRLLIDFNPRFYSQMGFEIARGLSLPMLVWHAARGDDARVEEELARARAWRPTGEEVYCHKTMLDLVLFLQGLSGQMSPSDVKRWRRWYAEHRSGATDAVREADDRMPAVIDAAQWMQHFARHPRSFVRSFFLNRS